MDKIRPAFGEGSEALRVAAVEIAKERGVGGLSLRLVAERGGVTHGLVRHHFGSRRGLIAAVMEVATSRTHYLLGPEHAPLSEMIENTLGELRVVYEVLLSGEYPEAIEASYEEYDEESAEWARGRGLPDDETTVHLIGALIDGLSVQRIARGNSFDSDAVLNRLLHLLQLEKDAGGIDRTES